MVSAVPISAVNGVVPDDGVDKSRFIVQKEGKYYVMIGRFNAVQFDSYADADKFLSWLSLKAGVPIEELDYSELAGIMNPLDPSEAMFGVLDRGRLNGRAHAKFGQDTVSRYIWKVTVADGDPTTFDGMSAMKNDAVWKGATDNKLPIAFLVKGIAPIDPSWFSPLPAGSSMTREQWENLVTLQAASLVSSARELFIANNFDETAKELFIPPGTTPSKEMLDSVDLAKRVFGNVPITKGHIAALITLGLLKTTPQGVAPTELGNNFVNAMKATGQLFVSTPSLDGIDLTTLATDIDPALFFTGKGGSTALAADKKPEDLAKAAQRLVQLMTPRGVAESMLPDDVKIGDSASKVLFALFGAPPYSAEEVNAAIMLGVLEFKPGTKELQATADRGKALLKAAEPTPGTTPPPPTPENKDAQVNQLIARGLDYLRTGFFDVFDVGSTNRGRDDDYFISNDDIDALASLEGPNDSRWSGSGHVFHKVPFEARATVIQIAKLLKQIKDQNPVQWQAFVGGDGGFTWDEMIAFITTHNPSNQREALPAL